MIEKRVVEVRTPRLPSYHSTPPFDPPGTPVLVRYEGETEFVPEVDR